MFDSAIYSHRRRRLIEKVQRGVILLCGNVDSPLNAEHNCYRFRQDSSFLYFCGVEQPGLVLVIDCDSGEELLYGPDIDIDTTIWSGAVTTLQEHAAQSAIEHSAPLAELPVFIGQARSQGRTLHLLPTCRAENRIKLAQLCDFPLEQFKQKTSSILITAVVALRSIKAAEELDQLDQAGFLGRELHLLAMEMAHPGTCEWEIAAALDARAAAAGRMLSFTPITTVRGEILHNHERSNQLIRGDLLLVDAGVESELHYASDHTRTVPVGGHFTTRQRDIYGLVLRGLALGKELIRPGASYLDIHLHVCRSLVSGLKDLGLMQGDIDDAVAAGAHALFMPHGLGHMLGLDVHDMEELGEDYVGYDDQVTRSDQFGTSNLRLGRALQRGFTLTVEPGLYFIPKLIDIWRDLGQHNDFINYAEVAKYTGLGGIRLEDDVVVTESGCRLLGGEIPLKDDGDGDN